jgi:hypothetical protein
MEDQEKKAQSTFLQDFYGSRTPFLRSILFVLLEALIPGIVVWLLVGNDFPAISFADHLPNPHVGYVALICFGYILFTSGLTIALFYLKAHKADNFTYSFTVAIVISFVTLVGYGLGNSITFAFVKFIIAIVIIILVGMAGVFVTVLLTNSTYRVDDKVEDLLQKRIDGQELTTREARILAKYDQKLKKEQERDARSAEIQKKLDEKLDKYMQEKDKE